MNGNRMRCLQVGCNPKLKGESIAAQHSQDTGHRVAKWPVRSATGKAKQGERNRISHYSTSSHLSSGEYAFGEDDF